MDATTFNKGKAICTRGTGHVAVATHPDFCLVPGETKPRPFPNRVETSMLKAGATIRTTIAGEAIWTQIGEVGPESDPAHEGTNGGFRTHKYRGEATALAYSFDVIVEGNGVVRSFDWTYQNHKNTLGTVLPKSLAPPELVGPFARKLLDDCPFLETKGNVEAPQASFDRLRRAEAPEIAGRGPDSIIRLSGAGGLHGVSVDVQAYDVTIDNETIRVNIPVTPPSNGQAVPTVDTIAQSLNMLPRDMLGSISAVNVQPFPMFDDVQTDNVTTLASTQGSTITFYPRSDWPQNFVDETMIHEATHAHAFDLLFDAEDREAWRRAVYDDGSYPSSYATASDEEDLCESMNVYMLSKGTPCEPLARALFPNRYRVLEEILAKPPPQERMAEIIQISEPEPMPEFTPPAIDDIVFGIPDPPPDLSPPPGGPPDSER